MSNVWSYWFILPKYDVHTSNSLQDIRQNYWTMKYRSQWPIFIMRSNFGSYWLIIPNNIVHTSNSLQDIRQNHWTMEYRSQWPTFILRSNAGSYWFILPYFYKQNNKATKWYGKLVGNNNTKLMYNSMRNYPENFLKSLLTMRSVQILPLYLHLCSYMHSSLT